MLKLIHWTFRYPKLTVLAAALLTAFGFFCAAKLQLRSNFSDLLADDHPAVVQAKRLAKLADGAGTIVIAVETKDATAAHHFIDDLRSHLLQWSDEVQYVDDRLPFEFIKKNALLYLPLPELGELVSQTKHRIEQEKLKKAKLFVDLGEADETTPYWEKLKQKYPLFLNQTPYYQNREGTLFVSFVKPKWRPGDVGKTDPFLTKLNSLIATLAPQTDQPSLKVTLTGPYLKPLRQEKILLKDVQLVSVIAFIGAIIYLVCYFRRKRIVALISIPLTVSTALTFVVAYLLFGRLNIFSASAIAVLTGISIDYGVHYFSEFTHAREQGAPIWEACQQAYTDLCKPFLVATSTAACAFLALALTSFTAFIEFGVIAGVSLFACVPVFLLLLPALIAWFERKKPVTTTKTGTDKPFLFFYRQKWLAPVAAIGVLLIAGLFGWRVRFDYNLNNLMAKPVTAALDTRVDAIFGRTVNPELGFAESANDVPALLAELRARPNGTTINSVLALPDLVPHDQPTKRAKIKELGALVRGIPTNLLNPDQQKLFDEYRTLLTPDTITLKNLPPLLLEKFRDYGGNVGRKILIFPNINPNDGRKLIQFVEELRSISCKDCKKQFYITGESSIFYEIVQKLFVEGRLIFGLSLLAIFIMLLAHFRSLATAGLLLTPIILGLLLMLGLMGILNIPLNIINVAAFPIILGTAMDYVIHFYQRWKDSETTVAEFYPQIFRPIFGSVLTTMIGFGSLLFAEIGAIRSFGMICCLGTASCTLMILGWFPAVLALKHHPTELDQEVGPILIDEIKIESPL